MRKIVLVFMVCVLVSHVSLGQPPEDPGDSPDTVDMPLDNGIMLMLMAGAGVVGLKFVESRQKK